MEYTEKKSTLKIVGLMILAAGLLFLAYKFYVNRYYFFDISGERSSAWYEAMYMKQYLQANPGKKMEFYFRLLGFWQPLVPMGLGLILTIIGKKQEG